LEKAGCRGNRDFINLSNKSSPVSTPFWQHLLELQPVEPLLSSEVGNFLSCLLITANFFFFFFWQPCFIPALICSSSANSSSVSQSQRNFCGHGYLYSTHCHQLSALSGLTRSSCRREGVEDPDVSPVSSLTQLEPQGQLLQVKTLFSVFVVTFIYR